MSVAIACMTNSQDLEFWLEHHIKTVGIDFIFLRVENLTIKVPQHYQHCVHIEQDLGVQPTLNSMIHQQERQTDFVNQCIKDASSMGIRFLLHIDDDELLILGKKWKSIQEYCASVEWESIHSLRIQNYEAVLRATPLASHEYFHSTRWFKNCGREPCRSYSNGKSIADVSNVDLQATGCHTFGGPWKKMKEEDGVILHFDSMSYPRWKTKFQALSKMSPELFTSVPFLFYKKSIECFWNENNTEQEKRRFWIEWVSHCEYPMDITENYSIV